MAILNYRQFDFLLNSYSTIFESASFSTTGQGVRIYPFTITSGMYFITEKGNYSISQMEGAIYNKQTFASLNVAIDGYAPICASWDAIQHIAINTNSLMSNSPEWTTQLSNNSVASLDINVPSTTMNSILSYVNMETNDSLLGKVVSSNSWLSSSDSNVVYFPWHDAFIKMYSARRVSKGTKTINNIITELEGIDADLTIISPNWNPNMFEQLGKVYVVLDEKISTPLVFKIVNAIPTFNPQTNELQYCTIQFKNVDLSFSEQNEGIFNYIHFSKPGDETIFPYETLSQNVNDLGNMVQTIPQYGTTNVIENFVPKNVDSLQVYNNALVGLMGCEIYAHYTYFVGFAGFGTPLPMPKNIDASIIFGYITSTPFQVLLNDQLPYINNETDVLINKVSDNYTPLFNMISMSEALWPSWKVAQETTYNPISDRNFQGGLGGYGQKNSYIQNSAFSSWTNGIEFNWPQMVLNNVAIGSSGMQAIKNSQQFFGQIKSSLWDTNLPNNFINNLEIPYSMWILDFTGHYGNNNIANTSWSAMINYGLPSLNTTPKNSITSNNMPQGLILSSSQNQMIESTIYSQPLLWNYGVMLPFTNFGSQTPLNKENSNITINSNISDNHLFMHYLNLNTFALFNIDQLAVSYEYGIVFKNTAPSSNSSFGGVINDIANWFMSIANDIKGYTSGWDTFFYNTGNITKSYTLFVPTDAVSIGLYYLNPEKSTTPNAYAIPYDIFSNQYSRITSTGQLKFACGFRASITSEYTTKIAPPPLPTLANQYYGIPSNAIGGYNLMRYLGQETTNIISSFGEEIPISPLLGNTIQFTDDQATPAFYLQNVEFFPNLGQVTFPANSLALFGTAMTTTNPFRELVIDSVKYKQVGQNNIRISFYDAKENQVGQSWVKSSAYIKQNFQYITNNLKYNMYTGYNFNTNGMTSSFPLMEIPEPPSTT